MVPTASRGTTVALLLILLLHPLQCDSSLFWVGEIRQQQQRWRLGDLLVMKAVRTCSWTGPRRSSVTQMNYTSKATSHPPTDERGLGEDESGLDESTHQVRVVISPSFCPGAAKGPLHTQAKEPVTVKVWEPKRKCPRAVQRHFQHHVVLSRALDRMLFWWVSIHVGSSRMIKCN